MAEMKPSGPKDECVKVCVRVRPLSSKEKQDGRMKVATTDNETGRFEVINPAAPDEPPKVFTFDHTFYEYTPQVEVFDACGAHVVDAVMEGYNGTVFVYGQTGSGKTHTMDGPDGGFAAMKPEERGLIPRCFAQIFSMIESMTDKKFLVRASYLEIYNEEIRDLLAKNPHNRLDLREDVESGVYVKDLTSFVVNSAANCDSVMQAGKKNRTHGATAMNANSSRSHSIFTVVVECQGTGIDGEEHICVGKLNLVDLAGSERQSKTGATGERLKEATKINLSLSALGNVISALVDGKSKHIPYRDSKLTRLLQDSLGGNTKTTMIANCGPADYNYDETLTTLRYANRAKNIKNKPKINEDPKDAMLREFQTEIERLKQQLAERGQAPLDIDPETGEPKVVTRKEVQVVERKVVEEKIVVEKTGIDESELLKITAEVAEKKAAIEKATAQERVELLEEQHKLEQSMERISEDLRKQRKKKSKEDKASMALQQKLAEMENKLVVGGQLMDKAVLQEKELRRAQRELQERQRQEAEVEREMAEKDEMRLSLEEEYKSLEEEAAGKTTKLKKLWTKFQAAQEEMREVEREFEPDREGLLDSIRELSREIKLKQAVIDYFVPPDMQRLLEARASFSEKENQWTIDAMSMAGNKVRVAAAAKQRKSKTKVKRDKVKVGEPFPSGNPFTHYSVAGGDGATDTAEGKPGDRDGKRSKRSSRSSRSKSRPKSASRSRRGRRE